MFPARRILAFVLGWLSALLPLAAPAADRSPEPGGAACSPATQGFPEFLFAAEGAKKILRYGRDGKITWDYPAEMSRDVWQLPNGHVLFTYNRNYDSRRNDNPSGVMEVTPHRQVVFHFATTGQVWSCQRLDDGSTLVGAASQGKLLIVNAQGTVSREVAVRNRPGHGCLRSARQVTGGNFVVAEESAHAVREYTPTGELAREIKLQFPPFSVVRLDNGNTVVCGLHSMVEIAPNDAVIWSLDRSAIPLAGIRWFAGLQVLPNGNLFVCNAGGKTAFLEINRDRQIVWQSNTGEAAYPLGHGICRIDIPGTPQK